MRIAMIAASAALASMSTTAYAADIYSKGGSLKDGPVAYEAPSPIWAGLYVGGSAGFGVGNTTGQLKFDERKREDSLPSAMRFIGDGEEGFDIASLFSSDYDVNGAIYGIHVGYNFQRDNVVFGAELGLNGTDIDGSDSCVVGLLKCERSLDWYATAVGRLGYASGRTLFYGFGGLAWGEVETDISVLGHTLLSGSETHLGWTAGLGIEHAMSDRFSVRVEYSHVDLGEEDHSLGEGLSSEVDLSFDAIKVGASYKLTGGHEALESLK